MSEQLPQPLTYSQIEAQGDAATVLVPRNNGEITTGHFNGEYDQEGGWAKVHVVDEEGNPAIKLARREGLSDQIQERLAESLGGAALKSTLENDSELSVSSENEDATTAEASEEDMQVEQVPETNRGETSIAEIVEESGLAEAVGRWRMVRDAVENGARVENRVLNEAASQLSTLLSRVRQASQAGPWAGNRFANHPQLMRQAGELVNVFRMASKRVTENDSTTIQEVQKFGKGFSEAHQMAEHDLRAVEDPQSAQIQRATRDVGDVLQTTVTRLGRNSDRKLPQLQMAQRTLESLSYDRHATVDDVASQLQKITRQLDDMKRGPRMTINAINELDEPVNRLQVILRTIE